MRGNVWLKGVIGVLVCMMAALPPGAALANNDTTASVSETIGANSDHNVIGGQVNTLGQRNRYNVISGQVNAMGNDNNCNVVSGSWNTLGSDSDANSVSGDSNKIGIDSDNKRRQRLVEHPG